MSLYIVPTPIGNLEDITLRALNTLKHVDLILCEDTRTSGILLSHYDIDVPKKAFHQHNERAIVQDMIQLMKAGQTIALISDAGTPGISDPGYTLIQACIENEISFTVLPGAAAIIPALLLSGFSNHEFLYAGFLPQKKGRKTKWEAIAQEKRTVVIYESPHRIEKAIVEMQTYLAPEREVAFVREISKMFEQVVRTTVGELEQSKEQVKIKGEFVIVIGP